MGGVHTNEVRLYVVLFGVLNIGTGWGFPGILSLLRKSQSHTSVGDSEIGRKEDPMRYYSTSLLSSAGAGVANITNPNGSLISASGPVVLSVLRKADGVGSHGCISSSYYVSVRSASSSISSALHALTRTAVFIQSFLGDGNHSIDLFSLVVIISRHVLCAVRRLRHPFLLANSTDMFACF